MDDVGAQHFGHLRRVAGEIARLVHHADEMLADQPVARIGDRQHQLLGQMLGQRLLAGEGGAEIELVLVERHRRATA